jgi:enoyl-CoA hydratase/carnithine racemase
MTEGAGDIVLHRREGSIGVLTLNNPARFNAVSLAMRLALFDRLVELNADDSCRAIVLTGAGGNFCSGGDISEMAQRPIIEGRMRVELSTRIFRMLATGPKPVICAIEGKALGCGVSFAAASDYAVAASDASFGCAFIKVGLIPDFGAIWSLARRVGHRKAMELSAFAEPFDTQAALDMQLLNRICEPGKALDTAMDAAEKFARNPPLAMALLKSALNTGNDSLDQAIATELSTLPVLTNSEDFAEATRAFMEKRKPIFTGR